MLMQVLDYTLNVCYEPGDRMHLSNALSCLSSHDKATGKTIQNLDISIHVIEELTGLTTSTMGFLIRPTNVQIVLNLISASGTN